MKKNSDQTAGRSSKLKQASISESCSSSMSMQYLIENKHKKNFNKVPRDQYLGYPESISGSSDTFGCIHGAEGKQYSPEGLLNRNLIKNLDPQPLDDVHWNKKCSAIGWGVTKTLVFLIKDTVAVKNLDRLEIHLRDFIKTSSKGYKINVLDDTIVIFNFLNENKNKSAVLNDSFTDLLKNISNPILLEMSTEVVSYFESFKHFLGVLGYLLMCIEDDVQFAVLSKGVLWQMSSPNSLRGPGAVQRDLTMAAASPMLLRTAVRMLAISSSTRFFTFLQMVFILASDSKKNCLEMMEDHVIENIFYRFNPYFPMRQLPVTEINPDDPQDNKVLLGDSSINLSTTMSLLLVLLDTTRRQIAINPNLRNSLPCPDAYSQRCFVWAYRYECRARNHQHQRNTLTVVISALLHIYGTGLTAMSSLVLPDIISMSVQTDVPHRSDWLGEVPCNTAASDARFKKFLIHCCVDFIRIFPYNNYLMEIRYWLLGLMYLLDSELSPLRARWSGALYAELRRIAMQALVCALPYAPTNIIKEFGMLRRILWYVEWYAEEAHFDLSLLYWCIRFLQVAIHDRSHPQRPIVVQNLFDTHGIIILNHLCYVLMEGQVPPVEKRQVIIAQCLRLLTSAVEANNRLSCTAYPYIKWPQSINVLAEKMLDLVLLSLEKHLIISERWLIALLNFIWEAIIWKDDYRNSFILNNGIYKLLDLITMTGPHVQCITMALICDVARAGDAVGQLITWRSSYYSVRNIDGDGVKGGSTIATLLAFIFRSECKVLGIPLDGNGLIEDLNFPMMTADVRKTRSVHNFAQLTCMSFPVSAAASDSAGSRVSKAFALLHMLSMDLEYKLTLADSTYNLYKTIQLAVEDELTLVLCSHYLTLKIIEAWSEIKFESPEFLPKDTKIIEEFLELGKGWHLEIRKQQEVILEKHREKEQQEEVSLYEFLARIRLNAALDGLRDLRRADRPSSLLHDKIRSYRRRATIQRRPDSNIVSTYIPELDEENHMGKYVKVNTVRPNNME